MIKNILKIDASIGDVLYTRIKDSIVAIRYNKFGYARSDDGQCQLSYAYFDVAGGDEKQLKLNVYRNMEGVYRTVEDCIKNRSLNVVETISNAEAVSRSGFGNVVKVKLEYSSGYLDVVYKYVWDGIAPKRTPIRLHTINVFCDKDGWHSELDHHPLKQGSKDLRCYNTYEECAKNYSVRIITFEN